MRLSLLFINYLYLFVSFFLLPIAVFVKLDIDKKQKDIRCRLLAENVIAEMRGFSNSLVDVSYI